MSEQRAQHGKRIALAAAAALLAVNIWTGAPLLALWVGSQFVGSSRLSMGAVGIVVVVLAALLIALVWLLTRVSSAYDDVIGRHPDRRQTTPWLRSLRGERDAFGAESRGLTAVEGMVVVSVGVCTLVFNIWFFFFAGSSLPAG